MQCYEVRINIIVSLIMLCFNLFVMVAFNNANN